MPCVHKNTLWCCVTEPTARGKFPEYDAHVRYLVARLRSAYSRHIGDPDWEEDIRRLASLSREFAELWARHEVADSEPRTLTYLHPRAGALQPGRQRARRAGHARGAHRRLHAAGCGHPGQAAADPPDRGAAAPVAG